jgi:Uma2 family endonuclease
MTPEAERRAIGGKPMRFDEVKDMSQLALADLPPDWETAVRQMVTEDDESVDNRFTEKQMRLLVEPLYSSWQPAPFPDAPDEPREFVAAANVGIFTSPYQPPVVPDAFLSVDTATTGDLAEKENRSYCLWIHEKEPEVVIEIVSDKRGGEFAEKMRRYGKMGVKYYVIFDPFQIYDAPYLRIYERSFAWRYRLREDTAVPEVGLRLQMWRGVFEQAEENWLRWHDAEGNLIMTGAERAAQSDARATQADERAAQSDARATRLAEKLRALGVDPDAL